MRHFMSALACAAALGLALAWAAPASATEKGMIRLQSPHSVEETAQRFEDAVRAKGLKVFPRIDHGAAAAEYGEEMPPTLVLGFGNPKYGTPFMREQPEAGIDFPPRAIVYERADGTVWLAYNTSEYLYRELFERHGLSYPEGDIAFFAGAVEELAAAAVAPE